MKTSILHKCCTKLHKSFTICGCFGGGGGKNGCGTVEGGAEQVKDSGDGAGKDAGNQTIRSRAEGTQARRFTVFGGGHGPAEYSPADKLVAMQYAIHEKVVQQLDWLAYNLYLIYQLEPSNERCVLVMRYISNMEWDKIAEKLCYSWQHIHRMHSAALNKLLEKLNTEKALRYERWKEEQKQPSYCDGQELAKLLDTSIAKAGDVIKELQKARAYSSMM